MGTSSPFLSLFNVGYEMPAFVNSRLKAQLAREQGQHCGTFVQNLLNQTDIKAIRPPACVWEGNLRLTVAFFLQMKTNFV